MKKARHPDRLRTALAVRDLSHRELSRMVGCSHTTIATALAGEPIGTHLARSIARVLRGALDVLFDDAMDTAELPIVESRAVS